jgi:CubicO group peptidase (beta-lactamase class C family)
VTQHLKLALRTLVCLVCIAAAWPAWAVSSTRDFASVAVEDGYVKCSPYGCSIGTLTHMGLALGRGADGAHNRTLLSFDTSALPDDAIVTRAYLTVAHASGVGDPWQGGTNPLYIDVRTGTFGSADTEVSDYAAEASAHGVATIAAFSSGSARSTEFSPAGFTAINRTGKTQLRLRFAAHPPLTAYRFIREGSNAVLHVEYETSSGSPGRTYWPTAAWRYKALEQTGFNAARIASLNQAIQAGSFGRVYSLLIVRDGHLVSERYFNGSWAEARHDLQSATKSIGSLMVGIAIDKGYLTLDDRIVDIFASYGIRNVDSRKQQMTVRHVLTHKHGSQWCEWDCPADRRDNFIMYRVPNSNFIQYVVDKPMEAEPGTVFRYSTGHSALLGGMIKQKTPYTPEHFAKAFLFDPIGMTSAVWFEKDSVGMIHTGSILATTAQDLARFGFLVLNDGTWSGQQIVSKGYLDAAYQVDTVDPAGVGMHYGRQMWIVPATVGGTTYMMRTAAGTGGQWVFVVPELDLVVVTTGWEVSGNVSVTAAVDMMTRYILPAALGL